MNADAIALAQETLSGALLKVNSGDDIMMSDKSVDVTLTDMTLIYVGEIKNYLKEIRRITRNHIVLCEFHHPSLLKRLVLKWKSGYNAYDYRKLLTTLGFYDIMIFKLKPEDWPDEHGIAHEPQKTYAHIIIARVPKRNV